MNGNKIELGFGFFWFQFLSPLGIFFNAKKVFSSAEARKRGSQPDIIRFIKSLYIQPSAEDFKGLLYRFLGTGRQGEMHMKYFKLKLLDPFAKGIRAWNIYKHGPRGGSSLSDLFTKYQLKFVFMTNGQEQGEFTI